MNADHRKNSTWNKKCTRQERADGPDDRDPGRTVLIVRWVPNSRIFYIKRFQFRKMKMAMKKITE